MDYLQSVCGTVGNIFLRMLPWSSSFISFLFELALCMTYPCKFSHVEFCFVHSFLIWRSISWSNQDPSFYCRWHPLLYLLQHVLLRASQFWLIMTLVAVLTTIVHNLKLLQPWLLLHGSLHYHLFSWTSGHLHLSECMRMKKMKGIWHVV